MTSDRTEPSQPTVDESDVATRVHPVVAPAAEAAQRSGEVVAWDDEATRQIAARRLLPTLVAAAVGILALLATIVLAILGVIQHPWGLWALVGLAGVAGGCIAGALAGWAIEAPLRRLLKRHPWQRVEGRIGFGEQLVVVADNRRRAYDLDLNGKERVGGIGTDLVVRAAGPVDEKVVEFGPKRRWRLSERVAVLMPDERDLDEVEDDDWQPTVPKGEQPDEDGLYAG